MLVDHIQRFFPIFLVIVDQVSKWYANKHLFTKYIEIVPYFLDFHLTYNRGASFGWFANEHSRLWLSTLGIVTTIWILVLRKKTNDSSLRFIWDLLLAGALSNTIDRLYFGHVIDFLVVKVMGYYLFTCNFADIFISLSMITLILREFKYLRSGNVRRVRRA